MRRKMELERATGDAKDAVRFLIPRPAKGRSPSIPARLPAIGLLMLAALVSACGGAEDQRVGSGAAIGAGAGAAVGVVAGPAIAGGVLVGAAAGGMTGLAVQQAASDRSNEPRAIVLRQLLQDQARLWNLSDPMLTKSAEVCRDRTRPNFGFVAWTRWDIDPQYSIASMDVYGLDDRLRVVHILPDSPAAAAGLLAGDVIEGVGPHEMPVGKTAGPALALVLQREAVVGKAETFRVRRGGVRRSLKIAPRLQCDIDLIVTDSDRVNAVDQGHTIFVTDGLMRFFPDAPDLAAVVAHVIGHSLLGQRAGGDDETLSQALESEVDGLRQALLSDDERAELRKAGTLPGARPYTVLQEIQADRAALELLARAGYPMAALVRVWRRLAETPAGAAPLVDFHPPSQERLEAAEDILSQVGGPDASAGPAPGS